MEPIPILKENYDVAQTISPDTSSFDSGCDSVVSDSAGIRRRPSVPVIRANEDVRQTDVIVYGGTSAGVIAAVQVSRMGKSVIFD